MLGNITKLDFNNFSEFNLYKIETIGDGSCLLHAISLAYFSEYINIFDGNVQKKRIDMIKNLRKSLSDKLDDINPDDPEGRTYYESLGDGEIKILGEELEQYSLESIKDLLDSTRQLGDEVIEYIQIILNKSLYFIFEDTEEVFNYSYGLPEERDSICLYVKEGHYDLIGLKENGVLITWFSKNHDFILFLRERINLLYIEE